MRILHVLGRLDVGGAENLIMNVYKNIISEDIQFDFVVHANDGVYFNEVKNRGGRIFCCPKYAGKNHFEYTKWWKKFFIEHTEYTIIHVHIRSTASIILKIACQYGLKTISHAHSISNGSGFKAFIKYLYQKNIVKYTDMILACSEEAAIWQFGKKYSYKCESYIIKNGIDIGIYHKNDSEKRNLRKEYALQDYFVVGHVGRFTKAKNHKFLLEIFTEIKKSRSDAILLLVGKGSTENEIRDIVLNTDLKDAVFFLGERNDISNILNCMNVFVFPSLWEGFGIAALEAQAAGLPTFVSDCVPKSVCATSLSHRIPIKYSAAKWADVILTKSVIETDDVEMSIASAGYDIISTTKVLVDIYKKLESMVK